MTDEYEKVAGLVSHIRNARFGEMVRYSEELIDSGVWRDFETPVGTAFRFERCEYDYFLASQDVDATTLRHAYANAAPEKKWLRLADITGRGAAPGNGDRRSVAEVAGTYASDPSGAGARIRAWAEDKVTVVTDDMTRIARKPERRKALESGKGMKEAARDAGSSTAIFRVHARGGDLAEAIVAKLLADSDLAHQVYKKLDAEYSRRRYEKKRRSDG